jgi:hypothetical protein
MLTLKLDFDQLGRPSLFDISKLHHHQLDNEPRPSLTEELYLCSPESRPSARVYHNHYYTTSLRICLGAVSYPR